MKNHDIIIIGAGFAGITAARELGAAGYSTLVLEARDRLGGRTWQEAHDGQAFELGGAYVHWCQPHVWAELTRYGLGLVPPDNGEIAEIRLLSDGELHTLDAESGYALLGEAYAALYAAHPQPANLFPSPYDPLSSAAWLSHAHTSLAQQVDALNLPPLQRDALRAMLATDMSASPKDAALIEMLRLRALVGNDDFSRLAAVTGSYCIQGGTAALLEAIRADSRAEYRVGQTVTHVEQTIVGVSVHTADQQVHAGRAALLATPINTWSGVTFTPPLGAEKKAVACETHAGQGFKCFVRVAGMLEGLLALAPEPRPFSLITTARFDGNSTWVIGFGTQTPASFTPVWAQTALASFLPHVQVLEVVAHDWTNDPFSRGTWANFRPGQAALLEALIRPEGRLYFAGGDIALGWRGFIDGAIESGLRAAHQVKKKLSVASEGL